MPYTYTPSCSFHWGIHRYSLPETNVYDKKIEEVVKPFFESYYSIEFDNYAVDDHYLHDHEVVPTGAGKD